MTTRRTPVIEHPAPKGIGTDRSHIRLVDEIRRSAPVAPDAAEPPGKGKKKAKKKAEDASDAKSKAKLPKLEGPKTLVRQILGMQDVLDGLRHRLESLDGGQIGQTAATARLARRLDAMDQEVQSRADHHDALQGRIDTLTETVAAQSDSSAAPDALREIGLGLERVAERVSRAESRLSALSGQAREEADLAPQLADIEGRIAAATRLLETQRDRIERLEQAAADISALREGQDGLQAGRTALATEIDRLRDSVDGRVQTLAGDLEQLRANSTTTRDSALARTRHDRSLALLLALLLVVAVLALAWWQLPGGGTSMWQTPPASLPQAPASEVAPPEPVAAPAPIAMPAGLQSALERITDRLEQLQSTDPSGPYTADLLDRLRRLETGMLDLTRALAEDDQHSEGLSQRLAELIAAQQDLDRRIGELEQEDAGTDRGIALLDARIDRLSQARSTPASAASSEDGILVVGASGAYGVQLVVYESSRRVGPFVAAHGLGERARSLEIRMDGHPAHAVLLGPYADESRATAAFADLAPDLEALGPWIRTLPPGTRLDTVH